jgi:hypothetical protein
MSSHNWRFAQISVDDIPPLLDTYDVSLILVLPQTCQRAKDMHGHCLSPVPEISCPFERVVHINDRSNSNRLLRLLTKYTGGFHKTCGESSDCMVWSCLNSFSQ